MQLHFCPMIHFISVQWYIVVQWYIFGYYCFILECMVGYYGYKCNISCDGCLSDSCDSEYGICTDVSGWKPRQPKCDLGILMKKITFFSIRK